jgi:acetyl-CoA carboxylase carboxyltransferase component
VLRKAYGGAYIVMASKYIRTDLTFAWPTAEIAVMGVEGAVSVVYRKTLGKTGDPAEREQQRRQLEDRFREKFANPYAAARSGHIDDVIVPAQTRPRLIAALELLRTKRVPLRQKKHGNIPL